MDTNWKYELTRFRELGCWGLKILDSPHKVPRSDWPILDADLANPLFDPFALLYTLVNREHIEIFELRSDGKALSPMEYNYIATSDDPEELSKLSNIKIIIESDNDPQKLVGFANLIERGRLSRKKRYVKDIEKKYKRPTSKKFVLSSWEYQA